LKVYIQRTIHRHSLRLLALLLSLLILASSGGAPPPTQIIIDDSTPTARGGSTAEETPAEQTPAEGSPSAKTPTPPPAGAILKTPYLEFGVAARLYYTDRERALTLANNAGFDWVREQVQWKDIEGPKGTFGWGELDEIVKAANAQNIKLLLSIVRSPAWARSDGADGMPDNPKDFGDFVEAMATRYKGKVGAYEIWNEQNLAHENGGHVVPEDAGRYVELLMEGYTRIKAIDPNAYVLAGPPSSTGFTREDVAVDDITYYRGMYSYKDGIIKDFFDAQAVHPGGSANPPDTLYPENESTAEGWTDHPTFYFRHIENVRAVMEEYGLGDHQVWITEYGWATANNTPGYEFGNQVTLEQQGEYVLGAMRRVHEQYPWVGAMVLWNLNYAVLHADNPLHEQASFGILNPDWSPRPAYHVSQSFINAVKAERGQ
jgi:polysaccharide biosynthesis protein PslG